MGPRPPDDLRIVYSTDEGRVCPDCSKPVDKCRCQGKSSSSAPSSFPMDGVVRLTLDRKGRRGKTVTVVHGLPGDAAELKSLAKKLKKKCGTGGAVKDGSVEFQGDHRAVLEKELSGLGHKVRLVGG